MPSYMYLPFYSSWLCNYYYSASIQPHLDQESPTAPQRLPHFGEQSGYDRRTIHEDLADL